MGVTVDAEFPVAAEPFAAFVGMVFAESTEELFSE
jgi:hypothetical protein